MTTGKGIFSNVEMKVEITNRCEHGRCKFCSPLFRPVVQEAALEVFLQRFERNLDYYLRNDGRHVILTGGGEPIDAPEKLFGALRLIKSKCAELGVELELLTVYTNGVNMLRQISADSSETYLDRLVSLGLRDINLSVHAAAPFERARICGVAMGILDIDTLISSMVGRGLRVMTRTTLVKGGVDSFEKVDAFVKRLDSLGVRMAYFSDLFRIPVRDERTTPGSLSVLNWTDDHRVAFDEILEALKSSGEFEFLREYARHNDQGRTFEFRRKGCSLRVMLGDLVIGDESIDQPTYAYVKPDGSMVGHNNARDADSRAYISSQDTAPYLAHFRPGREDL